MDAAKLIAIEYSPSQKAFHLTDMADVCSTNIRQIVEKKTGDYIIVGCAKTRDEAVAYADGLTISGLAEPTADSRKAAAAAFGKLFFKLSFDTVKPRTAEQDGGIF